MSAFIQRRPLTNRTLHNSPAKQTRVVSGSKRPRSPEPLGTQVQPNTKRVRPTGDAPKAVAPTRDLSKEQKHAERVAKEAEFRDKYRRGFPSWKFYFDPNTLNTNTIKNLEAKVFALGGQIEDFFSSKATHLITDKEVPKSSNTDKENIQNVKPTSRTAGNLKSPIKLDNRAGDADVVNGALNHELKIWSAAKLSSVIIRCTEPQTTKAATTSRLQKATQPAPARPTLSHLLQNEKIHGTSERDPTQKRHDYHYFTKGSCFVLIEDISQELAPIATHEYPVFKEPKDYKENPVKKPWPVLHAHPHSRNPFAPFDEKERKRWERQQQADQDEEKERQDRIKRRRLEHFKRKAESKKNGDLRRTASLHNLRRRLSLPAEKDFPCVDLDDDDDDSASINASGYLASGVGMGYVAASGNSVGVTSTTGTTSTSGQMPRNRDLVAAMNGRLKHVITSRKPPVKEKTVTANDMGPPKVPSKDLSKDHPLKKSKSMNTMKLPKREEGVKPGYCESCRIKFDDFTAHAQSKKHIKFALNSANYTELDFNLDRLRRRTRQEVVADERRRLAQFHARCAPLLTSHFRENQPIQLSTP